MFSKNFAEFDFKTIMSNTCHGPTDTLISLFSSLLACLPNFQSAFLMSPAVAFPVSLLVSFILFLVQLTVAHVFGALVVVCNESQINAACCHMRD